jgi:hypothetical protein
MSEERADVEHATEGHVVWTEIAPELSKTDFDHPTLMEVEFLRLMSRIRRASGVPFRIVSDHRPSDKNKGAAKSAHMDIPCRAIDLRVLDNRERIVLIRTALAHGIERIGVYAPTDWQKMTYGKASGSVHLDCSDKNPSPRMWQTW